MSANLEIKQEPTYTVRLYMAGDIGEAKQMLREECYREGLCVTVGPTTFIYTAGEEQGFVVGFVNYPRFPTSQGALYERAERIARDLLRRCCQRTCLLVTPLCTVWLSINMETK